MDLFLEVFHLLWHKYSPGALREVDFGRLKLPPPLVELRACVGLACSLRVPTVFGFCRCPLPNHPKEGAPKCQDTSNSFPGKVNESWRLNECNRSRAKTMGGLLSHSTSQVFFQRPFISGASCVARIPSCCFLGGRSLVIPWLIQNVERQADIVQS